MDKTSLNIHHTAIYASDDIGEQFDTVNESHRKRWDGKTKSALGFYGGYHYLIERSGIVQQFRNDWEVGAHNNKGIKRVGFKWVSANYYAIGISFAGNMSKQELTYKQIKAGVELVKSLQNKYKIADDQILPHRSYTPTQCPGNNLPDRTWEYLQEQYDKVDEPTDPIAQWHIKNKIITVWNNPPTPEEIKQGWIAYKILKAINTERIDKMKFDL